MPKDDKDQKEMFLNTERL